MIMIRRKIACYPLLSLGTVRAVLLGWLCLLLFSTAGAQQREDPAQVVLAASLHESARPDAAVIADLPAGESVSVLQMSGPWSRVRASAGEGWVLSSRLQVGAGENQAGRQASDQGDGGSSWLRSVTGWLGGSGSRRRSSGNVTIGTRGLQREDVANAQPDPAAVARLDGYVVSADAAKAKATAAGLRAVDFAYLDASAPAQSGGAFNTKETD